MLPQFYIEYLKTYLPSSELLTLQILVWLLQVHRQVRIERLASSFPYPIKCESRRKKIDFVLRLNKSTKIRPRYKKYQSLNSLDIKPGDKVKYNDVLVTENNQKTRFNVVVYWRRKYNNKHRI